MHKSSVWLTHLFTSVSPQRFSNVKTPAAARHNAVKICRLTALAETTDAVYHHAVTLPGRPATLSQLYFSKHVCRSFTAFHCCKMETSRKQMCYIRTRSSKSVNHTFCIAGKCKKPLLAHFGILLCCCMSSWFLCAFQMGSSFFEAVSWSRETSCLSLSSPQQPSLSQALPVVHLFSSASQTSLPVLPERDPFCMSALLKKKQRGANWQLNRSERDVKKNKNHLVRWENWLCWKTALTGWIIMDSLCWLVWGGFLIQF